MKPTHKKLVGGLFVSLLIATVGAAFATAQIDDATDDTTDDATDNTPPQMRFGGKHG